MATSDFEREQDAKAAEIGITIERRKLDVPKLNYKGQQLREKQKKKLLDQRIKLTLFDANGEVRDGCQWKVPRKKLNARSLQELISQSPIPGASIKFDEKDRSSNEHCNMQQSDKKGTRNLHSRLHGSQHPCLSSRTPANLPPAHLPMPQISRNPCCTTPPAHFHVVDILMSEQANSRACRI